VIHGDPVFSNILLKGDNTVAFLDMRGCLGNTMTLAGDVVYDLAKVYQSLGGYVTIIIRGFRFLGV
jgi:tRNA A-37 threonylcarbamoyl transferase component Bud32